MVRRTARFQPKSRLAEHGCPLRKAVETELPTEHWPPAAVACTHHDHLFCEVHANSSNLGHESSVFGFRLNTQTQSWHSMPCGGTAPETGDSFIFGSVLPQPHGSFNRSKLTRSADRPAVNAVRL